MRILPSAQWSKDRNAAKLLLHNRQECLELPLPGANQYYDSLTYSLERIMDGTPGITNLMEAVPALKLAFELESRLPF